MGGTPASGAPRTPSAPPERTRHRRPHRPSTGPGPGSEREPPIRGRGGRGGPARRRPLPARPVGKRGGGRRGGEGRGRRCREPGGGDGGESERGLPLARLGYPHRLSDGGARSPTGRIRPFFPGKHHPASGPPHIAIAAPATTAAAAGSSPPLGYWPDEAPEHAHSPPSRGSPDQSALPAINRSPGRSAPPPAFPRRPRPPIPSPFRA